VLLRSWAMSESGPNYHRIIHWFACLIAAIYSVYHLFWDIPLIGVFAAIASIVALLSTIGHFQRSSANVLYLAFFIAQLAALTLTSYHYGMRGVLLVFPIINALYYIFDNFPATLFSLIFIILCLGAAHHSEGIDIMVRSIPALTLGILFSAAFTQTMNDQNKHLHHAAHHDPLTHIHNRRGFLHWLRKALKIAQADGKEIALYFFDLDHFKQVNDQYGHDVGDQVLVAFTKRLIATLRSKELILERGAIQNLGRLSGDEFVFALVGVSSKEEVIKIGDRILLAMEEPIVIDNVQLLLAASIGVSFASKTHYAMESLLKEADKAMYQAKHESIDSLCIASN